MIIQEIARNRLVHNSRVQANISEDVFTAVNYRKSNVKNAFGKWVKNL